MKGVHIKQGPQEGRLASEASALPCCRIPPDASHRLPRCPCCNTAASPRIFRQMRGLGMELSDAERKGPSRKHGTARSWEPGAPPGGSTGLSL